MAKTFTTAFVQQVFRDRGVAPLFTEYTSAHVKLPFRCSCPEGREGSVSWANLYMRKLPDGSAPIPRCPDCVKAFRRSIAARPEVKQCLEARSKHTTASVQALFRKHGAEPLFEHYDQLGTPLPFTCKCGRGGSLSVQSIVEGVRKNPGYAIRCRHCITQEWRDAEPDAITSRVKAHMHKHGATPLFDSYSRSVGERLPFRCKCGNTHAISWESFRNFDTLPHCLECREKARPRGETHPNWDPSITDEQRAAWNTARQSWAMQKWYADVKKASSFTCALSGQVGYELASHHIAWVSRDESKMLDLSNGVCIAAWLHVLFHRLYPPADTPDEVAAWDQFCARYRAGEFTEPAQEAP